MFTIGVLGSGKGSNFRAIQSAIEAGTLKARTGVVVSDVADSGILVFAREKGIPAHHVDPASNRARLAPEIEQQIVSLLREHGVQLVVLAGFMRLIGQPLLEAFPRRIVNIHPSLLPRHRGLAAWKQALEAGDTETGCTVHYVDHGMDTGEIIAQRRVPVLPGDTPESLHARIQEAEHILYPEVIASLIQQFSTSNK